jgi:hypothetical protein
MIKVKIGWYAAASYVSICLVVSFLSFACLCIFVVVMRPGSHFLWLVLWFNKFVLLLKNIKN